MKNTYSYNIWDLRYFIARSKKIVNDKITVISIFNQYESTIKQSSLLFLTIRIYKAQQLFNKYLLF
jgi:predicted DNA-binding ArsR family transcriptional regulator